MALKLLAVRLPTGALVATESDVAKDDDVPWEASLMAATMSFAGTLGEKGPGVVRTDRKRVVSYDSEKLGLRFIARLPRTGQWEEAPETCIHDALKDSENVLSALHGLIPSPEGVFTMLARLHSSLNNGLAAPLSALLGVPTTEASPPVHWRARGIVADLGDREAGFAGALALKDGRVLSSSVPLDDLRPAWLAADSASEGEHVHVDGGRTPCRMRILRARHAMVVAFLMEGAGEGAEHELYAAGARLTKLSKALEGDRPPASWHVPGLRYLFADTVTRVQKASPPGKVSTLLPDTVAGLTKARNDVVRHRLAEDGEVAIRLHHDAWIVHRSMEGLHLWIVLEHSGESLLNACERVTNFCRQHLNGRLVDI